MPKTAEFSVRDFSLRECLAAAGAEVRAVLEKAMGGGELEFSDGLLLAQADGANLRAMVKAADEKRRTRVGDTITYVVNRNINFTNICYVGCAFCGFGRGVQASDAYFLSLDEIVAKAAEAAERGATEVCIQGGLAEGVDGFFYRDLLRAIKAALPGMHVHAFSPMEIFFGTERTGMPVRDYLAMLKDAGLGSIPGTAAEILDDEVRARLSPNKLKVADWVEIIRTAHELSIPSTSTMMYGHTESPEHWVRHMLLLREIQKETGGFTEFVPLAFVHENTRLYHRDRSRPGSTLREDLAVHALARLLLDGRINNLQVSWVKLGFDVSLACLEAGANDFSGTLMEESISKSAGATFGEYVAPEKFRGLIRGLGRIPAERTTTYRLRQIFSAEAEETFPAVRPATAQSQLNVLEVAEPAPRHAGTGY